MIVAQLTFKGVLVIAGRCGILADKPMQPHDVLSLSLRMIARIELIRSLSLLFRGVRDEESLGVYARRTVGEDSHHRSFGGAVASRRSGS